MPWVAAATAPSPGTTEEAKEMAANQSGSNLWVLFNGSNRHERGRSLNDKHFKCYWLFSPLERGDNLVNMRDIIKLNSYSANISNTSIIS